MKSCAPASRAARSIRSFGASGSANAMLAATVSLNRNVSSNTMPTARRRSCNATLADVDAVEEDRAVRRRRRSGGSVERSSSCRDPVGADERDRLAGLHAEVEAVEHRALGAGRVAEASRPRTGARPPAGPACGPAASRHAARRRPPGRSRAPRARAGPMRRPAAPGRGSCRACAAARSASRCTR